MYDVFKCPHVSFKASLSALRENIYRENIYPCKPEPEMAKPLTDNIRHLLFKSNLTDKLYFSGFSTAQTIQSQQSQPLWFDNNSPFIA